MLGLLLEYLCALYNPNFSGKWLDFVRDILKYFPRIISSFSYIHIDARSRLVNPDARESFIVSLAFYNPLSIPSNSFIERLGFLLANCSSVLALILCIRNAILLSLFVFHSS